MAAKNIVNEGLKTPSTTNKQLLANCGGMPTKKDVTQIEKINRPPANPPTSAKGAGSSVRV